MDNAPESIMNGVEGIEGRLDAVDHQKCKVNGAIDNTLLKKQALSNSNGTMKPPSDLHAGDGPEIKTQKQIELENAKLDAVKKCLNGQTKHFQDVISGDKNDIEIEKENSEISSNSNSKDEKELSGKHKEIEKECEQENKKEVVVNGTTQGNEIEMEVTEVTEKEEPVSPTTEESLTVVEENSIKNGKNMEVNESMDADSDTKIDNKCDDDGGLVDESEKDNKCENNSSAMEVSENDKEKSCEKVTEKQSKDDCENAFSEKVTEKQKNDDCENAFSEKVTEKQNKDDSENAISEIVTEKQKNDDCEKALNDTVTKSEDKPQVSLPKSKFSLKGNLDSVKGLVKAAVTKVSQESSHLTAKYDNTSSEHSSSRKLSESLSSSRTSSPLPTIQDSQNDGDSVMKDKELKETRLKEKEAEDAMLKDDHEGEYDSMEVDDSILDNDCLNSEPSPSNSTDKKKDLEPSSEEKQAQNSVPNSEISQENDATSMDTTTDITEKSENICDTESTEKNSPVSDDTTDSALSCNGTSQKEDETVKPESDKDSVEKKDNECHDSADDSKESQNNKEIPNGAKTEVLERKLKKEIKEEICDQTQEGNKNIGDKDSLITKTEIKEESKSEHVEESTQSESSKDLENTSRKRPHEEEGNSVLQNKKSRLDNVLDKIGKKSRLDDVIGKLGSKIGIKPEDADVETPTDLEEKEEEEEEEAESASVLSESSENSKESEDSDKVLQLTVKELNEFIKKRLSSFMKNNKKTLIGQLQAKIKKLEENNKEWQAKHKELQKRIVDAIYMRNRNDDGGKKKVTTRNMSIQVNSQKVEAMMLQGKTNPHQRQQNHGARMQTASASQASASQGMVQKQVLKSPTQSTTVRQMLNAKKNMPANSLIAPKTVRKARAGGGVIDLTDDDEQPKATTITLAPGQMVRTSMPASANIQKLTTVPQTIGQTLLRPGTILVQAPNSNQNTMVLQQMKGNTPTYLYASGTQQQGVVLQQGNQIRGATSQVPVALSGARPMQTQLIAVRNPGPGNTVTQVMTRPAPPLQTVVTKPLNASVPPPLKPAPSLATYQPSPVTTPRIQPKSLPSVTTAAMHRPKACQPSASQPKASEPSSIQATRNKLMDDILKRASELASQRAKNKSKSQDKDVEIVSLSPAVKTHPAPLPAQPKNNNTKMPKLEPPKPSLKISRIQQGIVLSWNMKIDSSHTDIKSYQLFAYQEGAALPNSALWKKVGDVKALPLPMACTLTQFQEGNKYHFAVRAVDEGNRIGPFSDPSSIHLVVQS